MGHHATALLTQLDATIASAQALWTHIDAQAEQHPHTAIYRSFPGMGPLLAARLLAELGDDPHRFPTSRNLRAFCAAAPITWASGTSHKVSHRRKANPILAETGHLWAFATLTRSPGTRALYDHRRATGDRHPRPCAASTPVSSAACITACVPASSTTRTAPSCTNRLRSGERGLSRDCGSKGVSGLTRQALCLVRRVP
ncbi:transposase [Micromonospora sp. M12]